MSPATADLAACVHCGLCLDSCPTYRLSGLEAASPRGRVWILRHGVTAATAPYLDSCLDCRACEVVCPSGVGAAAAVRHYRRQQGRRLPRRLLVAVLGHPRRVARLAALARLAARLGGRQVLDRLGRRPGATGFRAALAAAAVTQLTRPASRDLPPLLLAQGHRRGRVALHLGCAGDHLAARANLAAARLLSASGFDVAVPAGQVCCGALLDHFGADAAAGLLAAECAARLAGYDAVVSVTPGCSLAMRGYGTRLGETGEPLACAARDVLAYLAAAGGLPPMRPLPLRVAYHDACHLAWGQGVWDEPRRLLATVPGLQLVELPDPGRCCGSAGVENLVHPTLAEDLGRWRVADVPADVGVVTAANPACCLQLAAAARRAGRTLVAVHPVEILAAAAGLGPKDAWPWMP